MLQFATRAPLVTRVLVIQVLLVIGLSAWLLHQERTAEATTILPPPVTKAVAPAPPIQPVAPKPAPAMKINLARGTVGPIRLGMTTAQVSARLKEELVPVQQSTGRSARFEVVAPKAGLTMSGTAKKIDTITVTNAGTAASWRTIEGLRVGSRGIAVTRTFPRAQRICGHEWWVEHGKGKVISRFAGRGAVTAITVTKADLPLYVPCS